MGLFVMRSYSTKHNPLLALDVYKMGHMEQYKPGVTKVFSYLMARSDKYYDKTVFFGLHYYLIEYLSRPLEPWMAEEFLEVREAILGFPASPEQEKQIRDLANLGYWPLQIRAVSEGSIIPVRNALMTIENTHPDFYWVVGFVESLLLKVWYTTTVASTSFRYRETLHKFMKETASKEAINSGFEKFMVHDFGYRGDHCEEGAALSGVAHLTSFIGSDDVPAYGYAMEFYDAKNCNGPVMASVPASEHSVMCSFGREDEIAGFRHMLKTYPNSIVSIVSDTYSIWDVLTKHAVELKDDILARPDGAKVVFRPDSGDPEKILCGDPDSENYVETLGVIRLLDTVFGHTVNDKGYKVLNSKVGVLYGDGMYFERWVKIMERLKTMGYSVENLIIGVGGILRNHSRDTFGLALKATYVEYNGEGHNIMKDPVTDHGKKSHTGLVGLFLGENGFFTEDKITFEDLDNSLLVTRFLDGMVVNDYFSSLKYIRDEIDMYIDDNT